MKKLLFIYFLGITSFIFAQQKIGHVHVQKIMDVMPDVVTAMEELTKDQSSVEATLTSLYEEYQNKIAEYQQTADGMNDVIKQNKAKEIQDLELTIQQYQQEEQLRLQQKEQEMLQEIYEKIQVAVNLVAKETGCAYVLQSDGAVPIVLFDEGEGSFDITELVKKELNL